MTLLEKNERRLAALEDGWSALGSVRTFEFKFRFSGRDQDYEPLPAEDHSRTLIAFATEHCCTCSSTRPDEYGEVCVTVTKKLEPTAQQVTAQEEFLRAFVSELPGSYFDGWNYPQKKHISFWPDSWRSNQHASASRAAVLFGDDLVEDPLRRKLADGQHSNVFEIVPSKFLRLAQSRPPKDAQPTASSFAQWVYSLYGVAGGNDDDLERGKNAEPEIWERRLAAASCNDNRFLRSIHSPWELIHNGLHLRNHAQPYFFELRQLRVRGEPLKVSPDLLYANKRVSEVTVVEIKHSHLPLTKNLWPNIWAQLWCYSHIDLAAQANKVTVVGEIWSDTWTRAYGHGYKHVPSQRLASLRASVKRDPRTPAYDGFFRALFEIYAGN
ncbi:hypothetical protein E0H93_28585 [Rhizobium leguminosarum bv. viciae]|uniref:hypothetical protein n=1 Tax=Rhizobium leguminosarum TaxID=384 RepID=UPI00103EE0D9|nr:hypothetical protein [Rhizobium leguminosarum]TBY27402.1 hypothetical protein E0H55_27310 [Rhizobium leguminosarum bv. viciae]TCA99428.1 hypothetical protein E0H93_28585 [Rhizobium leguminosarum bv. viciae]